MAIYRNEFSVIKRSAGKRIVATAAYRAAERLHDDKYESDHDYRNKAGVLHSEIMVPKNAPDRLKDRATLWNEVEQVEKRKDAQLGRECLVALPHELTDDQRRELVRGYVQSQFVDKGMIADVAIHAPGREGDERNHHAHILLTMRDVDGDGFGKKNTDWNQREFLAHSREMWAEHTNQALERAQCPERVDHRSVAVQRQEQLERGQEAEQSGDQKAAREAKVRATQLDYEPQPQLGQHQFQTARRLSAMGQEIQSDKMREQWDSKQEHRSIMDGARDLAASLRAGFEQVREKVQRTVKVSFGSMAKVRDRAELRREGVTELNAEIRAEKAAKEAEKQRQIEQERQLKEQQKLERQERQKQQNQRDDPDNEMSMEWV